MTNITKFLNHISSLNLMKPFKCHYYSSFLYLFQSLKLNFNEMLWKLKCLLYVIGLEKKKVFVNALNSSLSYLRFRTISFFMNAIIFKLYKKIL